MRKLRPLLFVTIALLVPALAGAAPVLRPAQLTLSVEITGLFPTPYYYYGFSGALAAQANVSVAVDPVAQSIQVASGVLGLATPILIPVTSTTAVASVTAQTLSNGLGVFSLGGAGGFPGEPPCPSFATVAHACVGQSGFGGVMPVIGTVNIHVIPDIVVIPLEFGPLRLGEYGPGTAQWNTTDAAPFTVRTGQVQGLPTQYGGFTTTTRQGFVTASSFQPVAPVFVSALGNSIPVWARFEVEFTDGGGVPAFVSLVPEPAVALLLAAGVGLMLRQRMGSRA